MIFIQFDCFIRVYLFDSRLNWLAHDCNIEHNDCSIRVYGSLIIFFLKTLPIMLALCLMLLVTYYAFNYARIIGQDLIVFA